MKMSKLCGASSTCMPRPSTKNRKSPSEAIRQHLANIELRHTVVVEPQRPAKTTASAADEGRNRAGLNCSRPTR